jgi:hypothetical protein
MGGKTNFGLAMVSIVAAMTGGGALFIGPGLYYIGADDHHTKAVLKPTSNAL